MHRYIYKTKRTGAKVYSNQLLDNPNLELVMEIRDVKMKSEKTIQKIIKQGD